MFVNKNNVVLNEKSVEGKLCDKVRALISQFGYNFFMMNMKLLKVVTPPYIYHNNLGLQDLHHTTCVDEGVVVHLQGHGILYVQVCNTVTQLVVPGDDEATLFTIQGLGNR